MTKCIYFSDKLSAIRAQFAQTAKITQDAELKAVQLCRNIKKTDKQLVSHFMMHSLMLTRSFVILNKFTIY